MKKVISIICAFVLMAGMLAIPVKADSVPAFQVSSEEALPGEEVSLTVSLVNNPGIAAFGLDVVYDQNVLEWTGVTKGNISSGTWDVGVDTTETWFDMENFSDDADILTLTFRVRENAEAGASEVSLTYDPENVCDENLDNVTFKVISGGVTVKGEETEEAAQIVSASVNFKGTLGLNYYIYIPDAYLNDTDAYVEYIIDKDEPETVRKKLSALGTATKQGRECRKITVNTVVKSINDQVTLRLYDGEGNKLALLSASGKNITEDGFKYSVVGYCDNIAEQSSNTEMKDLAYKLKQYGFYVQKYLNYKAEEVTPELDVSSVTAELLDEYKGFRTQDLEGLAFSGVSFMFKEDSAIRYKFSLSGGHSIDEYSFSVNGTSVEPTLNSGKYMIEIGNIRARDLGTEYQVVVKDRDGNEQTLSYSGITYARTLILQGSTENAKNAAKAMYLYYKAAVAYFENN